MSSSAKNALGFDLSGRQAADGPNHLDRPGNAANRILARLAAIRQNGQTGQKHLPAASQQPAEPTPAQVRTLEESAARYRALRGVVRYMRSENLAGATEFESALSQAKQEFHRAADAIPSDNRVYMGRGVYARPEPEPTRADAGKPTDEIDADDNPLPKKRPHCTECNSNNVQKDGHMWTCGDCYSRFRKPDWKWVLTKSAYEQQMSELENKRCRLRAAFTMGEMLRHAARAVIYGGSAIGPHGELVVDTLADVTVGEAVPRAEAVKILLDAQLGCIPAFTYLALDAALLEGIRRLKTRWTMKMVERMSQQKQAKEIRGRGVHGHGDVKLPAAPMDRNVEMLKVFEAYRGGHKK